MEGRYRQGQLGHETRVGHRGRASLVAGRTERVVRRQFMVVVRVVGPGRAVQRWLVVVASRRAVFARMADVAVVMRFEVFVFSGVGAVCREVELDVRVVLMVVPQIDRPARQEACQHEQAREERAHVAMAGRAGVAVSVCMAGSWEKTPK